MSWRDDIAEDVRAGDEGAVLRAFDELWTDRERVRCKNIAYLDHIAELKGVPRKAVSTGELEKAQQRLAKLLKDFEASL